MPVKYSGGRESNTLICLHRQERNRPVTGSFLRTGGSSSILIQDAAYSETLPLFDGSRAWILNMRVDGASRIGIRVRVIPVWSQIPGHNFPTRALSEKMNP
jgi:hypothetical protein